MICTKTVLFKKNALRLTFALTSDSIATVSKKHIAYRIDNSNTQKFTTIYNAYQNFNPSKYLSLLCNLCITVNEIKLQKVFI